MEKVLVLLLTIYLFRNLKELLKKDENFLLLVRIKIFILKKRGVVGADVRGKYAHPC